MPILEFTPSMLLAILSEMGLLVLAGIILLVDAIGRQGSRRNLGWLTASGLAAILIAMFIWGKPEASEGLVLGGMLRHDWPAFTFKILLLFAAAVTALLSTGMKPFGDRGEFFALLVVTVMGMNLMVSAADLIMLYLAIETTSIPLYVLAGFLKGDDKSTESGLKYFLFGAIASAVMLYGFSLIYGFSGETNLYALAAGVQAQQLSPWLMGGMALLVIVGFGFKISAAPFHFWAPDVYEGAPTPITAYISTASKAAGFAVLVRVMLAVFPAIQAYWAAILTAMAVVTMTLGNLLALAQKNIKRLLAYSSIAHAGYILIGVVAVNPPPLGTASMLLYLIAYVVTNLAAFAVVVLFARSTGSDEIEDYAGLSRRSPGLALSLLVALLSLAGMPPFAGFIAKVYIFAAAVQSGLIWLAFVGVINAIIGLYYYLTILKVVYLYRSDDEDRRIAIPGAHAVALVGCIAAVLIIGIISGPWLDWTLQAVSSWF
ncbi:MAG TPA: NADH-quinone oxidoreductase subunit N [Anaerolineae bacterium]|nr:NADH-quinone oxidoreductase subunit N [Anaerolineae bacterium]